MTSGTFTSIAVDSITVPRDERQRRDLGDIADLARSIAARGLINPIVVTLDRVLVAGERRLTAVRSLGWTHISAQFAEGLSVEELRLIELEENTKRLDLPWQDQCRAVTELHEIHKAQDPEWTIEKTAEVVGLARQAVQDRLRLCAELSAGTALVVEASSLSTALNYTIRKDKRAGAALQASIVDSILVPKTPKAPQVPLYNADIEDWLTTYEGPKFNFIHCDFPYGTNFDKQHGQNSANMERYDDSFGTYKNLIENVLPHIPTAEQCHIMFWFSPVHFEYTKLTLIRQGWIVNPFPLIWVKSDNSGLLPDPQRGGRRTYEMAFAASKGDRLVAQPVAMHWYGPRGEAEHASLKPRPMLAHFFRMFVDTSTVMLDPTCGSGNAVRMAKDAGASYVAGVEASEVFWGDAVRLWDHV